MANGFKTGGRQKGTPNKSSAIAREAIGRFVDGNVDKLQEWLDEIAAQDGPKVAFQCFTDLLEYHVPKLGRTELAGDEQSPVKLVFGWKSAKS